MHTTHLHGSSSIDYFVGLAIIGVSVFFFSMHTPYLPTWLFSRVTCVSRFHLLVSKKHVFRYVDVYMCVKSPLLPSSLAYSTASVYMTYSYDSSMVSTRYMLGLLSSVLEEVENSFEAFQFYKASQVIRKCDILADGIIPTAPYWCGRRH